MFVLFRVSDLIADCWLQLLEKELAVTRAALATLDANEGVLAWSDKHGRPGAMGTEPLPYFGSATLTGSAGTTGSSLTASLSPMANANGLRAPSPAVRLLFLVCFFVSCVFLRFLLLFLFRVC